MALPDFCRIAVLLVVLASGACGSAPGSPPVVPTATGPPAPLHVGIFAPDFVIGVGETDALDAYASYASAPTIKITDQATWQSSDAGVAVVSAGGIATGLRSGHVEIQARYLGVSGTMSLRVV